MLNEPIRYLLRFIRGDWAWERCWSIVKSEQLNQALEGPDILAELLGKKIGPSRCLSLIQVIPTGIWGIGMGCGFLQTGYPYGVLRFVAGRF